MIGTVLTIGAAIAFGLAAFRVQGPVEWVPLGYCLLTIALFLV